ncbi:Hint domain-containing protein [Aestuariivita boseongensis]|uniref:Hint domain-containing protein n=1 Tax=Aestuariivita boseongensis TaxID=1470562 RepID=UPI000681914C|nr:Hint domain-containing protein [Aestuariivita boseongensis]
MGFIFYSRGDSSAANNGAVNSETTTQTPTTELRFEKIGPLGDYQLDFNNGASDPDTLLYIDGVARFFTVEFSGTLPESNKFANVNGLDLRGEEIVVITDDMTDQRYYFLTNPDYNSFLTMDAMPNGAIPLGALNTSTDVMICFSRGTRLDTPSGARSVEQLEVGDLVTTTSGPKAIVWIGSTKLTHEDIIGNPNLRPVMIEAGAFGVDNPKRALILSPNHRILLADHLTECLFASEKVLCAIKHLIDGTRIRSITPKEGVEYFHILLESHEVLNSENLWSESLFLGDLSREMIGRSAMSSLRKGHPSIFHEKSITGLQLFLPELKAHEAAVWRNEHLTIGRLAA